MVGAQLIKMLLVLPFFLVSFLFAENEFHKYINLSNLKLDSSNISDVVKIFGDNSIIKSGDASTSSNRFNYFLEQDSVYITFNSGEMGGGKVITDFVIKISEDEKYITNKDYQLSDTDLGGLKPGITIDSLTKQLGTPPKKRGEKYCRYESESFFYKKMGEQNLEFSDLVIIIAKLNGEMVEEIEIIRIVVN